MVWIKNTPENGNKNDENHQTKLPPAKRAAASEETAQAKRPASDPTANAATKPEGKESSIENGGPKNEENFGQREYYLGDLLDHKLDKDQLRYDQQSDSYSAAIIKSGIVTV